MASFVKVRASNRNMAYLNLRLADDDIELTSTASGYGLEVPMLWTELDEEKTTLEPKQSISFYVGDVCPKSYHAQIHVNPMLHALGQVSHATLLEPGDNYPIFINYTAKKRTDLREIHWLCRFYLID